MDEYMDDTSNSEPDTSAWKGAEFKILHLKFQTVFLVI